MQASIEVKRIDLWTLFRIAFFIYGAIGLIIGLFYAFVMVLAGGVGGAFLDEDIPGLGLITGVFGIMLVPVLAFVQGAIGAVFITIGGAMFNLICRFAGGLMFDVALAQPAPPPGPVAPAPPPVMPPAPQPPPPPEAPPTRPPDPPHEPPRFAGDS